MDKQSQHECPSVFPEWPESKAFAVVAGTAEQPEITYLDKPLPVNEELLKLSGPVSPTEVFRFSGPCAGNQCRHFDPETTKCRLASRTVRWVPVVVDKLPQCSIRKDCVWWNQEGRAACMRCPQVPSSNYAPTEAFFKAAWPSDE